MLYFFFTYVANKVLQYSLFGVDTIALVLQALHICRWYYREKIVKLNLGEDLEQLLELKFKVSLFNWSMGDANLKQRLIVAIYEVSFQQSIVNEFYKLSLFEVYCFRIWELAVFYNLL